MLFGKRMTPMIRASDCAADADVNTNGNCSNVLFERELFESVKFHKVQICEPMANIPSVAHDSALTVHWKVNVRMRQNS